MIFYGFAQEEARLRTELLLLPLVGPKLVKLTQSGVSEQDIINIVAVFEKYVAGKDRQSFISEPESYGSIEEFSKQSERMKIEVTSLQTKIQDAQLIKGSLTILESKNKSMEVDRDILNTPEDEFADIHEMQENAVLVPLVKAARNLCKTICLTSYGP